MVSSTTQYAWFLDDPQVLDDVIYRCVGQEMAVLMCYMYNIDIPETLILNPFWVIDFSERGVATLANSLKIKPALNLFKQLN